MKTILSTYDAAEILCQDDNAMWTRRGALALVEYLEDWEQDTGEEMEFDFVAIRCEFSEYESLQDWADDYFVDWKDSLCISDVDVDEIDGLIREYIYDHGSLIEFSGGIIVSSF